MNVYWLLGILLLCPIATLQRSTPSSPSYVGAVVEYKPELRSRGDKSARDLNADNYLKFIEKASQYAVDIIVFPESSLSMSTSTNSTLRRSEPASYIPHPKDKVLLCDDDKKIYAYSLKILSCAAREHGMYVVVNHREKVDCPIGPGCPKDGLLIYNTNVVFDRLGQVIARYRKFNLFGEGGTNVTAQPDVSTFKTDFNVTFGQFICFDIMFETPTLNLTRDLGITDIVFSHHWFSELPYLFSVEAHAAWAYANDVNLLSSGYNNPSTASGGSQIYLGRNGYAKVISENKESNVLIISEISKVINVKRLLNINKGKVHEYRFSSSEINTTSNGGPANFWYQNDNLSSYTTELIKTTTELINKTLCDRDLCCDFNLKIKFDQSVIKNDSVYYTYRLTTFNGTRTFSEVATGGVKICGIISCVNETLDGCGQLLDVKRTIVAPTTFKSIDISIRNINNENSFFMPVTLTNVMVPLNVTEFSYKSIDSEGTTHIMNLKKPRSDLISFGLFGRYFPRDGSTVTEPSSSTTIFISPSLLLAMISLCALTNLNKC